MSPVKSVEERTPRPPVVGRIRIGVYGGGRPHASKTFVFTSPDRFYLEPLAEAWGGEPERFTPQGQTEEQWRLVTTSEEIVVLLPFGEAGLNWEQWRELYGSGHIKRRCDEETAQVYTVDEETGGVSLEPAPCICNAQERLECDLVTRLRCWIPAAGMGVWEFGTHSKNAAFAIPDEFALVGSYFEGVMNKLPVALRLIPRRTTRWDPKKRARVPTTVLVVSMRLAVDFAHAQQALAAGGNPALETFARPALGAGAEPRGGPSGPRPSEPDGNEPSATARPTVEGGPSGAQGDLAPPPSSNVAAEVAGEPPRSSSPSAARNVGGGPLMGKDRPALPDTSEAGGIQGAGTTPASGSPADGGSTGVGDTTAPAENAADTATPAASHEAPCPKFIGDGAVDFAGCERCGWPVSSHGRQGRLA